MPTPKDAGRVVVVVGGTVVVVEVVVVVLAVVDVADVVGRWSVEVGPDARAAGSPQAPSSRDDPSAASAAAVLALNMAAQFTSDGLRGRPTGGGQG
jgi:hypothetical protein